MGHHALRAGRNMVFQKSWFRVGQSSDVLLFSYWTKAKRSSPNFSHRTQ